MNKNRKTAIIVGVLILLAYSILGSNNPDAKILGMLCEVISGLAVIIISILMFPYLKPYGKKTSLWYLVLKGVEGILMVIAGILFLIHSTQLLNIRDGIYLVHGYIFAIPALLFYYLLYKSKLIPRWLSIWGVIAAIILIIVNLLEATAIIPTLEILYLPIVLNEVVLAIWLFGKGFNSSAITLFE
ncbi:MAG: DUF4386 domain-containing protein [Spirochaetales bacterium]|nr:DUF4386 domain-containing protein [Spirochaetales bacterium]